MACETRNIMIDLFPAATAEEEVNGAEGLPITAAAAFFASAAGDLKEIGHPTTAPPLAKLEGNSAGDIKESDGPMKVRKARASKRTNAPSTTCVATELAGMRQLEHSVDTCSDVLQNYMSVNLEGITFYLRRKEHGLKKVGNGLNEVRRMLGKSGTRIFQPTAMIPSTEAGAGSQVCPKLVLPNVPGRGKVAVSSNERRYWQNKLKLHYQTSIGSEHGRLGLEGFTVVTTEFLCLPSFMSPLVYEHAQAWLKRQGKDFVSHDVGISFKDLVEYLDIHFIGFDSSNKLFQLLCPPGCSSLKPEDFRSLVELVVLDHPGLEMLRQATAVEMSAYVEYVIARIMTAASAANTRQVRRKELAKVKLLDALRHVGDFGKHIDGETHFFSFVSFLFINEVFKNLDRGNQWRLSSRQLLKYGDGALTEMAVERLLKNLTSSERVHDEQRPSKVSMTFKGFVNFMIAEEDKTSEESLRYFFRLLDVNQTGIIHACDVEEFWNLQLERLGKINVKPIDFNWFWDESLDLFDCREAGYITLKDVLDLTKRPLGGIFFDQLINTNKCSWMAAATYEEREKRTRLYQAKHSTWHQFTLKAMGGAMRDLADGNDEEEDDFLLSFMRSKPREVLVEGNKAEAPVGLNIEARKEPGEVEEPEEEMSEKEEYQVLDKMEQGLDRDHVKSDITQASSQVAEQCREPTTLTKSFTQEEQLETEEPAFFCIDMDLLIGQFPKEDARGPSIDTVQTPLMKVQQDSQPPVGSTPEDNHERKSSTLEPPPPSATNMVPCQEKQPHKKKEEQDGAFFCLDMDLLIRQFPKEDARGPSDDTVEEVRNPLMDVQQDSKPDSGSTPEDAQEQDSPTLEPLPSATNMIPSQQQPQKKMEEKGPPTSWSWDRMPNMLGAVSALTSFYVIFKHVDLEKEEKERQFQHCLTIPQELLDMLPTDAPAGPSTAPSPVHVSSMHSPVGYSDECTIGDGEVLDGHPFKPVMRLGRCSI